MNIELISAIIQIAIFGVLIGYTFHVLHKWSKMADKINAICDDAKDEAAQAGEIEK